MIRARFPQFPHVVPFTPSVGSSGRPAGNSRQPLEASLGTIHEPDPYAGARRSTSELELLEGHGLCGRCAGSGRVSSSTREGLSLTCPRCEGTGRKAASR